MPKRMLCTGGCGRLLYLGTTSRPEPKCRACRAQDRLHVCEQCGETYDTYGRGHPERVCRFCSKRCADLNSIGKFTRPELTCEICSRKFRSNQRVGKPQYTCDKICANELRRRNRKPPPERFKPRWSACADPECPNRFKKMSNRHKFCGKRACSNRRATRTIMEAYRNDPTVRSRMKAAVHARRKGSDGKRPLSVEELIDRDDGYCQLPGCGRPVRYDQASIGHIIPLSRWKEVMGNAPGVNDGANLRLEHLKGNLRKHTKLDDEIDWKTWSCF